MENKKDLQPPPLPVYPELVSMAIGQSYTRTHHESMDPFRWFSFHGPDGKCSYRLMMSSLTKRSTVEMKWLLRRFEELVQQGIGPGAAMSLVKTEANTQPWLPPTEPENP